VVWDTLPVKGSKHPMGLPVLPPPHINQVCFITDEVLRAVTGSSADLSEVRPPPLQVTMAGIVRMDCFAFCVQYSIQSVVGQCVLLAPFKSLSCSASLQVRALNLQPSLTRRGKVRIIEGLEVRHGCRWRGQEHPFTMTTMTDGCCCCCLSPPYSTQDDRFLLLPCPPPPSLQPAAALGASGPGPQLQLGHDHREPQPPPPLEDP
jgi:hypothetical protein